MSCFEKTSLNSFSVNNLWACNEPWLCEARKKGFSSEWFSKKYLNASLTSKYARSNAWELLLPKFWDIAAKVACLYSGA